MTRVPAAQIDKCFGFDTAVEESQRALLAAKVEAASAFKGIGVVKLMGRQSGFIAMQASMASGALPAYGRHFWHWGCGFKVASVLQPPWPVNLVELSCCMQMHASACCRSAGD